MNRKDWTLGRWRGRRSWSRTTDSLPHDTYCYDHDCRMQRASLAAIDALRGSGNPDTPPSAEKGKKP